jgi:hypothetical protein
MYTMERNCLRKAVFLYGIFWFDIFNSVTATKLCVVFGLKMMTFTQIPAALGCSSLRSHGGMNSPLKGARGGFMSHSPSSMEVVEGAAQ